MELELCYPPGLHFHKFATNKPYYLTDEMNRISNKIFIWFHIQFIWAFQSTKFWKHFSPKELRC